MFHGFHGFGGMWFWIIAVIFLILMLSRMFFHRDNFNHQHGYNHDYNNKGPKSPMEILKERYAKGEISREEFEKMKNDLKEN